MSTDAAVTQPSHSARMQKKKMRRQNTGNAPSAYQYSSYSNKARLRREKKPHARAENSSVSASPSCDHRLLSFTEPWKTFHTRFSLFCCSHTAIHFPPWPPQNRARNRAECSLRWWIFSLLMVTPRYGLFLHAQHEDSGFQYPPAEVLLFGGLFEEEGAGNVCIITGATREKPLKSMMAANLLHCSCKK